MTVAELHHPLRQHVASVGLIITWSAGFIGSAFGTQAGAAPFTLLSWRFLILSAMLCVACLVTGTSLRGIDTWRRQTVLALLCQVGYLGFIFVGIAAGVPPGTEALIAALQPLLVMAISSRLLGEHRSHMAWLGTVLGFAGVVVVVGGDIGSHDAPAWVYVFPFLAMLSLTVGTVLTRRLQPSSSLLQSITMQAVVTGGAFFLIALIAGQFVVPASPGAFLAIGWLILVPSIGGYGLYVYVTRTAGATVVSTLLYLTPPTTMLWAWLLFGDAMSWLSLIGVSVSAVGVVLVLRARPK